MDNLTETFGLALQSGQGSFCFCLHHGLDTICFTFLQPADFFCVRFGQGFDLHFLDLSGNHDIGVLAGLFAIGPGPFRLGFGCISLLKGFG